MQAKEIMTTLLVTAGPETPVTEIAQLMMEHKISAVPVVTPDQRVLGLVSETDLLRRQETGREALPNSWWLMLFNSKDRLIGDVNRIQGDLAQDLMTTPAITVDEAATIEDVATLFLVKKINQAPVIRGGKLVGVVSRGDLISAIARH